MRTRVFYVINLDKSRILYLTVIFTGLLLIAFATGYRMGTASAPPAAMPEPLTEKSESDPSDFPEMQPVPEEAARESSWFSLFFPETTEPEKPASLSFTEDDPKSFREIALNRDDEANEEPEQVSDTPNPRAALLDSESLSLSNIAPGPATDTKIKKPAEETQERKPASDNYRYSFQIASFKDRSKAEAAAEKLRKDGFDPFIEETSGKFTVKTGRADSRRDLWNLESRLKKKDYRFFLTEKK